LLTPFRREIKSVKQRSISFLKKRTKKLLSVGVPWPIVSANEQKFFGSFFQKRTASLLAFARKRRTLSYEFIHEFT
jgi:hypothetical protein